VKAKNTLALAFLLATTAAVAQKTPTNKDDCLALSQTLSDKAGNLETHKTHCYSARILEGNSRP
jgi:hypothetical protein